VVALEQQRVDATQAVDDVRGDAPRVGQQAEASPLGGEDELAGLPCVVGYREGPDLDVAQAERATVAGE
jgi:hypothetical protein